MSKGPPAYAWDWFARQRLLWREVQSRLVATTTPAATRYAPLQTRAEVLALLRVDYPRDAIVRATVDVVISRLAFLGRTDRPFSALGVRTPPRGMRWWWTALTGEEIDAPATDPPPAAQLPLLHPDGAPDWPGRQDVLGGYGDRKR